MIIWWFFTNYGMQLVYIGAGLWFANGVRKAIWRPRFKLFSYSATKAGTFVEIERQELLPPWRALKETWMRHEFKDRYGQTEFYYSRESDGGTLDDRHDRTIERMLKARQAREKETEELLKEERAQAQA